MKLHVTRALQARAGWWGSSYSLTAGLGREVPGPNRWRRSGDDPKGARNTAPGGVIMPAFNAGRTLQMTYRELPPESCDLVILVDDASKDDKAASARERDYGYGSNSKACRTETCAPGRLVASEGRPG